MKRTKIFGALLALGMTPASQGILIAYYPLDDTTGDIATAVYGNNGVWRNPGTNLTWGVTGPVGTAADMNGTNTSNSRFDIDLRGLLNSDKMSVSMWFNPDSSSQSYEGLFMVRPANPGIGGTAAGNGNFGLAWRDLNGGYVDTRGQGAVVTPNGSAVIDNAAAGNDGWYHVLWVWDGELGTQTVYLNGVEAATGTGNIGTLIGGVWHLGNDACCAGRDFNGQVDDLGIWDEALTATDAADLFAKTKSPAEINPPSDNDDDGLPNAYEIQFPGFLDPDTADADQDVDTTDGDIASTAQPDGLTNAQEFALGTDPTDADSDDDGILDGEETITGVDGFITDPLDADVDNDGLLDGEETSNANGFVTDPTKIDTDGDTFSDKSEIDNGTDPTDPTDPPIGPLPTEGLIALYKLDETEGTTASDSATLDGDQSSTEATGTIAWTTEGIIGGAIDLDGSSYLRVNDAIPASAPAFSMAAWIKPGNQGSYRGIFAARDVGATPNLNWGLNVEGSLQGDLRFATAASSAGYDTPGVVVGEWNLLTMTWTSDGFEAVGKAYLNGAYVGEYTTTANGITAIYSSPGFYLLGAEPNPNRAFIGQIDEVSVWNVALTDADVSNIYRNGIAGVGLTGPSSVELAVTDVNVAASGDVTLVWNSNPASGTTYVVKYTTDLSLPFEEWAEIDDEKATGGDTTTLEVPAAFFTGDDKFFFAVKQN